MACRLKKFYRSNIRFSSHLKIYVLNCFFDLCYIYPQSFLWQDCQRIGENIMYRLCGNLHAARSSTSGKTKRIKSEFGRNTCKYIPIFEVQFIPSFGKAYVCVRQTTWLCYPCDLALWYIIHDSIKGQMRRVLQISLAARAVFKPRSMSKARWS